MLQKLFTALGQIGQIWNNECQGRSGDGPSR